MTLWQRQLTAMITVLASAMVATHGAAQEPAGKVMLPWQKPQPSMRPAPDMREILPWLMGEEEISKPGANDVTTWAATVADPAAPVEPVVAEPVQAKARLETGTVVPSGLVLKKPVPVVHAVAAAAAPTGKDQAPVAKTEAAAAPSVAAPALTPDVTPSAPVGTGATSGKSPMKRAATDWEDEAPAAKAAQPAVTPANVEVVAPTQPAPAAAAARPVAPDVPATPMAPSVEPAKAPAAAASTPVVEAAPAMPEAEEVPSIPDPLPEAVVTPVPAAAAVNSDASKSGTAKSEPATAPARAASAAAELVPATKPNPPKRLADGANVAQQYCFNIADAAKDARYAWQKKTLADIEIELKKRIALLDQRTAEYQKWLARRDEFIRTAEEGVVKIYSGMKPDTAATQLALMNEETAAAVLVKLSTRNASAILNEMESAKAARLTQIITGAAKLKRKKQREQEEAAAAAGSGEAATPATDAAPAAAADGGRS